MRHDVTQPLQSSSLYAPLETNNILPVCRHGFDDVAKGDRSTKEPFVQAIEVAAHWYKSRCHARFGKPSLRWENHSKVVNSGLYLVHRILSLARPSTVRGMACLCDWSTISPRRSA